MQLDIIEQAFMDNIVRKWFLRHLEAIIFYRKLTNRKISSLLEIGCGRGDGILIHEELYHPEIHCAFDINPNSIESALKIKSINKLKHVKLWVGDVRSIPEPAEKFDAVIGYGVLHHIHNWQIGLQEINRVLKPGGIYAWEEPFEYFNGLFISKALLSHPEVNMTYRNWMEQLGKNSLKCVYGWPIKNPFITLGISIKRNNKF